MSDEMLNLTRFLLFFREELEPRLLREHPRPSSRDTTGSKCQPLTSRMIDSPTISTPTSVSSTTSQSSSLRDSETRLPVSTIMPRQNHAHSLCSRRFYHSHDEENPKGTSQGNFTEVAGGGTFTFFSYLIYYIRKERERWTLFPIDPSFK